MWVIVVDPPEQPVEVIGPFETSREAHAFEDARVDAPEGSRAYIAQVVPPESYRADPPVHGWTVELTE